MRTVGLPGLEALAVTFGQVVTAQSPAGGRFNWGMALWHELGHVFSIQLSRSRVPRWFTEGLSEYETARVRPEWTRHTHAELYRALEEGKLLSVTELNRAFTHARDLPHMVVAYHQAAEEVSFLIRRFGFEKVPDALKRFGQGGDTAQVIPQVTGLSVPAFDAAFRADLAGRLKPYEGTFSVRPSDYSDAEALKDRVKEHPEDARAAGLYALSLIASKRGEEARKIVDQATASILKVRKVVDQATQKVEKGKGDDKELIWATAQLELLQKNRKQATHLLEWLISEGGDGYDARFQLGQLAAADGNVAEAEKQLALAKNSIPIAPSPTSSSASSTSRPARIRRSSSWRRQLVSSAWTPRCRSSWWRS